MEKKKSQNTQRKQFLKLTLKKNIQKTEKELKLNHSSDVILIDDSFDRLKASLIQSTPRNAKIYSPIVINDSSELSHDELPKTTDAEQEPSRTGNVSFNCSQLDNSLDHSPSKPSSIGWSPAQAILTAKPSFKSPSTPKDIANTSQRQCSMEKIVQTQRKVLTDLYGDEWKSIPSLLKTLKKTQPSEFNGATKKLDFEYDSDKENNVRSEIRDIKQAILTGSDAKKKLKDYELTDKKSKKKLFTEKVPSTPNPPNTKPKILREVNSTTKKNIKGKSVTELVEILKDKFEPSPNIECKTPNVLKSKKITSENVTPVNIKKLSFMASLADNVPDWRCHPAAVPYIRDFKKRKDELSRLLYVELNKNVFDEQLPSDLIISFDNKLRSTAGTTTNRLIKTQSGDRIRSSSVKLSSKVVDNSGRLRDTLVHELCHVATWIIDHTLKAGHGPLWRKWASKALKVYPELVEISRCHTLEIHYRYSYKCTRCGYTIKRHSKSLDITKKCCGYCKGTFELILNKKNKDGVIVTKRARKGQNTLFTDFVKEKYAEVRVNGISHGEAMKILGDMYAAKKKELNKDF